MGTKNYIKMEEFNEHYKQFLKVNPESNLTYSEWFETVLSKKIEFKRLCVLISARLSHLSYDRGDIADIGNEIGYVLGQNAKGSIEEISSAFMTGLTHGIDLAKNYPDILGDEDDLSDWDVTLLDGLDDK